MPKSEWIDRVAELGETLDEAQQALLFQYCFLVRKWSSFTTLVSAGDQAQLESLHLVDSLSLAPYIRSAVPAGETVFDIGTGGGFPAIPLAVTFPDRRFVLMERNAKKVSFLRKVMGALKLGHVSLIHGSFPGDVPQDAPHAITARAVERSDEILGEVAEIMPEGCVFLCQSGDPAEKIDGALFHVEQIRDKWSETGARRGSLHLIRRRALDTTA